MNFDIVANELDRFFIHTCEIQDKTVEEILPGGEQNETWTTRQSDGEDIEYVCRREEIEVGSPFPFITKRKELNLGIQTKLLRLYLEGSVPITGDIRISNINGDGKKYEISSDFNLVADEGTVTADTQEIIIQEVIDA